MSITLILLGICLTGFHISCEARQPQSLSFGTGGYSGEITTPPDEDIDIFGASDIFEEIDNRLYMLDPHEGEILGRFNAGEVGELLPAEPLDDVVSNLLLYSQECYGAFDPTLQILWDVYDFEMGGRFVSETELADALEKVNYRLVEMDGTSILRKEEDVRIGFGPVDQGVVMDWMVDLFESRGIINARIDMGSCLGFIGDGDGTERVYEFKYPIEALTENTLQLTMGYIRLKEGEFLSALDDDEKFFFSRGDVYHMVLNPVTGKPVRDIRAAVVVSEESCLQASVFAYAVMVMGLDRGLEFLDETEGVEGLIFTEDHEVHVSGGLGERFWR